MMEEKALEDTVTVAAVNALQKGMGVHLMVKVVLAALHKAALTSYGTPPKIIKDSASTLHP